MRAPRSLSSYACKHCRIPRYSLAGAGGLEKLVEIGGSGDDFDAGSVAVFVDLSRSDLYAGCIAFNHGHEDGEMCRTEQFTQHVH